MLVLHETKPAWAGSLRDVKDTMEATALSINALAKRFTRLWSVPSLPADAFAVLAVPGGGGMVLCGSMLMYVSQVGRFAAACMLKPVLDASTCPKNAHCLT